MADNKEEKDNMDDSQRSPGKSHSDDEAEASAAEKLAKTNRQMADIEGRINQMVESISPHSDLRDSVVDFPWLGNTPISPVVGGVTLRCRIV